MKNKRAISPLITTILLVMLAIILAVIFLLWARGFVKEAVVKFGEPIERSCDKVDIKVALTGSELSIINQGDISVYKLGIRASGAGTSNITILDEMNFLPGSSRTFSDSRISAQTAEKAIPILLGSTKDGSTHEYQCPSQNWASFE